MVPTRNVTMRNLRIVSRNWCVGSATFGGIYEVLFEDSTIGDLEAVRIENELVRFLLCRFEPLSGLTPLLL